MARKFKYGAEGSFLSDPWDPTPMWGRGVRSKSQACGDDPRTIPESMHPLVGLGYTRGDFGQVDKCRIRIRFKDLSDANFFLSCWHTRASKVTQYVNISSSTNLTYYLVIMSLLQAA